VLEANVTPIYETGGEEVYSTGNPDLPPQAASKQKGQPEPTAANGRHKRNCNSGEGVDTKPGCSERPPNPGIVTACIVKRQQQKVGSKVVGESVKQQQQPECPKNASGAALEKQPNKQDVSWLSLQTNFTKLLPSMTLQQATLSQSSLSLALALMTSVMRSKPRQALLFVVVL